MKKIFMDLRYAISVSNKSGKFNGGNKACQRLAKLMGSYIDQNHQFIILVPPNTKIDIDQFLKIPTAIYMEIEELSDIKGNPEDVLWIPLVNDSIKYACELESFKKENLEVKIYIHLHDRRYKYLSYDRYDGILSEGIKSNPVLYYLGRKIHACQIEFALKKICKVVDKVFTVSNYSMQCLNEIKEIKSINLYFQGILCKKIENVENGNFLLFVSAGRPEKNFYRTLIAFKQYINLNPQKNIKLVVTGLNDYQIDEINRLMDSKTADRLILKKYVDEFELNTLYASCRGLLFTSKNEGFGLPVLEALYYQKPCIVSNASSIPEVLGSIGIYVDPFSVESIVNGISVMMDDEKYKFYKQLTIKKLSIVKEQIKLDDEVLMHEIIN